MFTLAHLSVNAPLQVGQKLLQLDVITESLSKQVMEHHEEMGMQFKASLILFTCGGSYAWSILYIKQLEDFLATTENDVNSYH